MCMLHSLIHVAGVKGQDKFKVTVVILANTIRIVPYWRLQKKEQISKQYWTYEDEDI